jgi:hypothetical protein
MPAEEQTMGIKVVVVEGAQYGLNLETRLT